MEELSLERLARLEEQGKNQAEVIKSILQKLDNLPERISEKMERQINEVLRVLQKKEQVCEGQRERMEELESFRTRVEISWKWALGIMSAVSGLVAWGLGKLA
jgi:hypothetical protein